MAERKVIGIDIGGSHITAGIVDLDTRQVNRKSLHRIHVNSKGSADEIINAWSALINELFATDAGCEKKVGIAMPGPFNYEDGICLIHGVDKFESMYGLNIKNILAEKIGIAASDILFMNDASCFLKGEVFSGAAVNRNHVIGITLGTGLGSARYHDGKVYEGVLYCSPFKDGMTEDYISTRWFLKEYKNISGESVKDVKELCSKISSIPAIKNLFAEFGKNLGHILNDYAKTYSCNTIVIGGNLSNTWDLFFKETEQILEQSSQSIIVKKAILGEEGALVGAASLWQQD